MLCYYCILYLALFFFQSFYSDIDEIVSEIKSDHQNKMIDCFNSSTNVSSDNRGRDRSNSFDIISNNVFFESDGSIDTNMLFDDLPGSDAYCLC